jgi:hypothetical protein
VPIAAGVALAVAVLLIAVRCGSGVDDAVAERFVLKDTHGRTRAVLGLNENEDPGLMLFDRNGVTRAELSLTGGGWPHLVMTREKDKPEGIELVVAPGRTEFVLRDPRGQAFVSAKKGGRAISINGPDGSFVAGIVVGEGADPVLELYGEGGNLLYRAPGRK